MKKKFIAIPLIFIALVIAFCVYLYVFPTDSGHGRTAVITSDGKVVRTVDLETAPDESFTVESENGYNIVVIKDGGISVTEASCPDKICVKHGELKSEMLPIVCLPNRLVIELR